MGVDREWRPVQGYEGAYECSYMGEIRSYRAGRWGISEKPHLLTPYKRQPRGKNRKNNREYVKLTDSSGKAREICVAKIISQAWLHQPEGTVVYHKNGLTDDHRVVNIGFTTPEELGKMTARMANKRRPVCKISTTGEVVQIYPSAREAARKNHISYQAIIDRCHGKVKKPFALDGHTYKYET